MPAPKERDYIDALAKRYSGDAKPDRKALDQAYANAMKTLAKKYPDDLDAATLYVESLMDLRPWNYWTRDGVPYADTPEIVSLLESVMKRNPNHPGACHFYIHAVEATKSPERAEAAADRLFKLMPGAGHMVHMPSHIYFRVGRYADASKANSQASAVDEEYIAQCRTQGIYPLAYYPHNLHFLYSAASFEGNSELTILAAEKVAAAIPHHALEGFSDAAGLPGDSGTGSGAVWTVGANLEAAGSSPRHAFPQGHPPLCSRNCALQRPADWMMPMGVGGIEEHSG